MAKSNTHCEHWTSSKAGLGWLGLPRYLVLVGGWPLHTLPMELLRHLEFLPCCWTRLGQLRFPELAAASFTNSLHSCQTAAYLQFMNNLCWASQELHRILRYSTLLPWDLINLMTTIRNVRITVAEQSSIVGISLKDCFAQCPRLWSQLWSLLQSVAIICFRVKSRAPSYQFQDQLF